LFDLDTWYNFLGYINIHGINKRVGELKCQYDPRAFSRLELNINVHYKTKILYEAIKFPELGNPINGKRICRSIIDRDCRKITPSGILFFV
jgi:hypothetical protein